MPAMREAVQSSNRGPESISPDIGVEDSSMSKQLEAELRVVLDAVPAGVLLLDTDGRVQFLNPAFAQLFGCLLYTSPAMTRPSLRGTT